MAKIQKGVVYGQGGGRDLKLDLYRPDGEEPTRTAVLLLHGGGWRFGDRSKMELFGPGLARLGFIAVAPEYRLLAEAPWPVETEDVKAAIRWRKASAAVLDIHPDCIAVQGFSAGGHLALMAGGTQALPVFEGRGGNDEVSDRVAAVIAFFPSIAFAVEEPGAGDDPGFGSSGRIGHRSRSKTGKPSLLCVRSLSPHLSAPRHRRCDRPVYHKPADV